MPKSIDPSLTLWYPFKDNPSLEAGQGLGPTLTLTRSSKAWMKDGNGYIVEVPVDEGRFQSAQATRNLILQSEDLTTTWTTSTGTIVPNVTKDPNGRDTADEFIEDTSSNPHRPIQASIAGDPYKEVCASVYVKRGAGQRDLRVIVYNQTDTTQYFYAQFDTETGEWVGNGNSAQGSVTGYGSEDVGNGWFRVWASGISDATGTAGENWQLQLVLLDQTPTTTYAGDGVSSLYFWGAQVELIGNRDARDPSPYVKTTTAAVYSVSGANDGLLLEEGRTNIALRSEDFVAAEWPGTREQTFSNVTKSPDGQTTADRLQDDGTLNPANAVFLSQTITTSTSTPYTMSVFAKQDQLSWMRLSWASGGVANCNQYFDLANGVLGTGGSGVDEARIEDYGNGWYRCSLQFTSDAADTTGGFAIYLSDGDNDSTVDLDGTSSIFLWGAQFEQGLAPTSYIPTPAASTVTRNADACSTSDVSWFSDDAPGTMMCEVTFNEVGASASSRRPWTLIGSSTSNRYAPYISNSGSLIFLVTAGGATAASLTSDTAAAPPDTRTLVTSWAANDFRFKCDGDLLEQDTAGALPTGILTLYVGSTVSSNRLNGLVKELRYYNEQKATQFADDLSESLVSALDVSPSVNQLKGMHLSSLPTSTDPRWHEIIDESGITQSGDFIDDCHAALESLTGTTGDLATLYKKYARQYLMFDSETLRSAGGYSPNRDYSLGYNFTQTPSLEAVKGPTLTFTRATSAWAKNEDGYLREYYSGDPRFPGAAYSHNLVRSSNNFDVAAGWSASQANITKDAVDAPPGLPGKGSFVYDDATASTTHYIFEDNATMVDGDVTLSVYIKDAGDGRFVSLRTNNAGSNFYVICNPVNGDITEKGNGVEESGSYYVGDGWYRVWMKMRYTANAIGIILGLATQAWPNDDLEFYNGDGASGVYLYGAQVELVSGKADVAPSDYISTSSTAVSSVSGTSDGILIEEASTNLCLQSEDFDNITNWTKAQSDVVVNQTASPEGSDFADKLIDDGLGGTANVSVRQSWTGLSTSTQYCFSVFAKADQLDKISIRTVNFTTPANAGSWFDLGTGTVGTQAAGNDYGFIEDWGNGWYRCSIVFTTDAVDTEGTIYIQPAETDAVLTVARDGTSSVFIWGAQFEERRYPSSYIPTTTGSVTRNKEECYTTDMSWMDSTVGSYYWRGQSDVLSSRASYAATALGVVKDVNDRAVIRASGSFDFLYNSVAIWTGGAQSTLQVTNPVDVKGVDHSICITLATTDAAAMASGGSIQTDTSSTHAAYTSLYIGGAAVGGYPWNGVIKEVAYWPEQFNDTWVTRGPNGSIVVK